MKSADLYPEDDETHCRECEDYNPFCSALNWCIVMLSEAIDSYSAAKVTAREMLSIMERIRIAYPKMQLIWKYSNTALQGGHKKLVQVMEAEEEFRQALAAGAFKLDDPIMLQSVPA